MERRAWDVLDALHQLDQEVLLAGFDGREADAAVAHHDGRDAVIAGGREVRIPGGLAVVVGVDVDEARRDREAGGVDLARASPSTSPTATILPSRTAMSPVRAGAPVPSMMFPLRITRS